MAELRLQHFLNSLQSGRDKILEKQIRDKSSSLWKYIRNQWECGVLKPILAWVTWLMIGTVFYSNVDFDQSYSKGFYYSVNVGYSIGWGVLHEPKDGSKLFSTVFLLIGATAISGWLAYFIEHTIDHKDKWYEDIALEKYLDTIRIHYGIAGKVYAYVVVNAPKISHVLIWLVYIIFGVIWSCRYNQFRVFLFNTIT